MWSTPRDEDKILDTNEYFNDSTNIDTLNSENIDSSETLNSENIIKSAPKIDTISFNRVKIRKAINGVKIDVVPGPDGVTPALMKIFCDQILD